MKPSMLLLSALLLTASACKKDKNDPNGLPKATQDGKNTAGFLLDGQVWLPQKSLSSTTAVGATWLKNYHSSRLVLGVNFDHYEDNDKKRTYFGFEIPNVRQTGTYILNRYIDPVVIAGPRPAYAVYTRYNPSPKRAYYTGPQAIGQVTLTRFDTIAHVVSGTFQATVREDGGADSLHITEGRFDLSF